MEKRLLKLLVSLLFFVLALALDFGLPYQQKIVFAIVILAMFLWILEVFPLFLTALIASFMNIVLVGFSPTEIFTPYFDPVVVLLLGGFVLAVALQKHKIDKMIAFGFLKRIGTNPMHVLLGLMFVTAFLSMWISNTASTAIMIPIALIILKGNKLKKGAKYSTAMVLGIAYAATVGGLGSIIGSTPNPMAVKFLEEAGTVFSFTDWLFLGVPFVAIFIFIILGVLFLLYRPKVKTITFKPEKFELTKERKITLGIFALTVLLWLTTKIHGISSSTIAVVPIILLFGMLVLKKEDLNRVSWGTLLLLGGGLSLGAAIIGSGLDKVFAGLLAGIIPTGTIFLAYLVVIVFAIGLTVIVSNTVAAAVMLPLIAPLALTLGFDPRALILVVAFGVSLDFIVPIGTPPNAIAYSTGMVDVKDMVKAGLILSVIAAVMLAGYAMLFF